MIIYIYCDIMRPYQGFWGFREKGHLFSGSWGALAKILRDLGSKQRFREQKKKTFRELRKNKLGSWKEGLNFFREQGAKIPPGRASIMSCWVKVGLFSLCLIYHNSNDGHLCQRIFRWHVV